MVSKTITGANVYGNVKSALSNSKVKMQTTMQNLKVIGTKKGRSFHCNLSW